MEKNPLNRLQMVQFECPRVRNLMVSFTFGEFPFLIFCHCIIKKLFIMGRLVKKEETFRNKISLIGCKWSSLNAPGSETPWCHSLLESSPFSFSATALLQYKEMVYYGRLGKKVEKFG